MSASHQTPGSVPGAPPSSFEPTITKPHRRRRAALVTGALAAAAVLGVGAIFGVSQNSGIAGTPMAAVQANTDAAASQPLPSDGSTGTSPNGSAGTSPWGDLEGLIPGGSGGTGTGGGSSGSGGTGSGQLGTGQGTSTLEAATADQQIGVVAIDTVLAYQGAEADFNGIVLTADGEILTNNHVIAGATSITVTIVSSGESYPATVVGTDVTDDVAVLQLSGASDLTTANFSTSTNLTIGDEVTGVGNAGGVGGTPSASQGSVTALNQTITTQAESGAASETLHGLIQTDADIQSGDSGGPLFDATNQVVGIDTAAQVGGYTTEGYAIPIGTALSIAQQIQNGQASQNIVIGYPAFLGVQVTESGTGYRNSRTATVSGALIAGVVTDSPAATAGLTAGDTITAVDGTAISTSSDLTTALTAHSPGDNVTITWTAATGATQSESVTLVNGPAL